MEITILRLVMTVVVVGLSYFIYHLVTIRLVEVEGWTTHEFSRLKSVYQSNFDNGLDKGSTFVMFHKGKLVAHLWGGFVDFWGTKKWGNETVAMGHSISKAIGSICLAIMVDRGHLNYSAPVAQYWPEFSANGKSSITVDQLLSHQGGLAAIEDAIPIEELHSDWPSVVKRLSNQRPLWTPGTEAHYHALTLGLYMDELFRRVDPQHRRLHEFFDEEIRIPLKLDLKFGLSKEQVLGNDERYAAPYSFSNIRLLVRPFWNNDAGVKNVIKAYLWPNSTYYKSLSSLGGSSLALLQHAGQLQQMPLISSNIVGNCLSFAKLFNKLSNAKSNVTTANYPYDYLLTPKTLRKLTEPLVDVSWMSSRNNFTFGRGVSPILNPLNTWMVGSPGLGGQMAYADPKYELSWAYLTNHLSPYSLADDPRHLALIKAVYQILSAIKD